MDIAIFLGQFLQFLLYKKRKDEIQVTKWLIENLPKLYPGLGMSQLQYQFVAQVAWLILNQDFD